MLESQYHEFGRLTGLAMTGGTTSAARAEKNMPLTTRILTGDKILSIINASRMLNIPIKKHMIQTGAVNDRDLTVSRVEDIAEQYKAFKELNNYYDYTDMLVMAVKSDLSIPDMDVWLIDEAQDLSTLQWAIVDRLASNSKKMIIVGDDKQAINSFSGADVHSFLNVPGRVEVLQQSYRVPTDILKVANGLMNKMTYYRKEGADWRPKNEKGHVENIREVPINKMREGQWFVLARASHQLERIRDALLRLEEPLIFSVCGASPIPKELYEVITLFRTSELRGKNMLNEMITLKDSDTAAIRKNKIDTIRLLKKFIECDTIKGEAPWVVTEEFREKLKLPWYAALDKITNAERRYARCTYNEYLKKGTDMFKDAPVQLMTMHASKGREADNVLVILDAPKSVQEQMLDDADANDVELKILYVAVTRAKHNLYFLNYRPHEVGLQRFLA